MKVETYLAKFYDVNVRATYDDNEKIIEGVVQIEIYERGEDSEPIGWFLKSEKSETYEWRNIYGSIKNKTVYANASEVKAAAKRYAFLPIAKSAHSEA